MDSGFLTRLASVFLLALYQGTPAFFVWGVKPHLALATIVVYAAHGGPFGKYSLLALGAVLGFALQGGVFPALGAFVAAIMVSYGIARLISWRPVFAYIASVISGTALLYFFSGSFRYILDFPHAFMQETALTLVFGAFVYAFTSPSHEIRR